MVYKKHWTNLFLGSVVEAATFAFLLLFVVGVATFFSIEGLNASPMQLFGLGLGGALVLIPAVALTLFAGSYIVSEIFQSHKKRS